MEGAHKVLAMTMVLIVAIGLGEAQTICNMSPTELNECRPSVTPPNPTPPSRLCCTALSKADLNCFCAYRNSIALPSFGIDPNLAMQLPKKCKLSKSPNC